ncbi:unnamed protein product [Musa hybrid cultivar]
MEVDWFRAQQGSGVRRGRRRKRAYRVGGGMLRTPGCGYLKGQRNDFGVEYGSDCSSSFRKEESSSGQGSYNTSVKPRERPMDKEIPREAEIRWSSPSVIAKLMGLDEQPPVQVAHKRKKTINGYFQDIPSTGLQEKYLTREECLPRMSMAEHQEFKDVYEVIQRPKVERDRTKTDSSALPSLKQRKLNASKQWKSDVSFLGQNLLDAVHLPSDESLRISEKFTSELGNQDCTEHNFLNVFQEPDFLFRKYFHDSKRLAPSHLTSKKTIFKSSNGAKTESGEVYRSLKKMDRFVHMQNGVFSSFRIPIAGKASRFLKVQNDSLSHKLARFASNNYQCIHPNHIVLLKHNIDKSRGSVHLRTPENFKFSHRRPSAQTGFREANIGRRDWLNFSHNSEAFHCKNKGSRELDREITELRESVSSSKMSIPVVEYNRFSREDSSCNISDMKSFCSPEGSSNHFNNWNSICFALAPSTEFIRSEARKNFSGNWKMAGNSKETVDCGKCSSVLAEMLALSDVVGQNSVSSSSKVHNVSVEKSTRPDMRASGGSPLSISNSDSWEDGFLTNLPNPASVPASSTTYGSQNLSSMNRFCDEHFCTPNDVLKLRPKKSDQRGSSSLVGFKSSNNQLYSNLSGKENNLSSQEIHLNQDRTRKGVLAKTAGEGNFKPLSIPNYMDVDMMMINNEELPQLSMASKAVKDPKVSNSNLLKETSFSHLQVDCERLTSVRITKALQPCAVSELELPLRVNGSGCFESLTGDLELHSKTLTSKLGDQCAEASEVLTSSNDDDREVCEFFQQAGHLDEEFMDEEEREYTYLLDILIFSGVHSAKQDSLRYACYLPEDPVNPNLFEKLEKKYGKLVAWSRSERKLMFDLSNSIVAEILAPCMDLHPWVNSTGRIGPMWGSEGLVEKTWQMLVKKRIELGAGNAEKKVLDTKWFNLEGNIDEIGREIERTLKEELLEELVEEFIIG